LAIGIRRGGAGGVGEEFFGEAALDVGGLGEEELFEVFDVLEGAAVGELAGGIDGEGDFVLPDATVFDFGGGLVALLLAAVAITPAADDVEALQSEAGRVDLGVAAGAVFGGAVFGQNFADGAGATGVGLDAGNAGWGWWRRLAEESLHHPAPPKHGRADGAIGGDFQDAGLREQAAAHAIGGELHADEFLALRDIGADAIMLGDAAIQHQEVAVNEIRHREVVVEDFSEEGLCFADHGILQHLIEFGIKRGVGRGGVDAAQVEPLTGEVLHEGAAALVGEEAIHLRFERFGLVEFLGSSEAQEFIIRQRGPEEVGES